MHSVEKTEVVDGPLVFFGPTDRESQIRLAIPSTFERKVRFEDKDLELVISCEFEGEKVAVRGLRLTTFAGGSLGTRDLTQLGLPNLVHEICVSVIPNADYWMNPLSMEATSWDELKTSDIFVAQVYWLQHVSHGNPRATLMSYFGMPRSSCNLLLRKLKLKFEMPRTN
jgi:hypothetical protein